VDTTRASSLELLEVIISFSMAHFNPWRAAMEAHYSTMESYGDPRASIFFSFSNGGKIPLPIK